MQNKISGLLRDYAGTDIGTFRPPWGYTFIMKKAVKCGRKSIVILAAALFMAGTSQARSLTDRVVSVGAEFGDPSGITLRYPLGLFHALDAGFGPDYFGSPRLQLDYLWEYHLFNSTLVGEYFGPGLAVAFAKGINAFYTREPARESFAASEDNRFAVGGTVIFGMSITPKSFPFEFFVESGPLIPISHILDIDLDGAIGFRYRL